MARIRVEDATKKTIKRLAYDANEVIFSEGDAFGPVFLVKRGKVELYTMHNGKKTVLDTIGKDCVFGEMSVIDKSPRSATAKALEETECYALDQEEFEQKLEELDPFMRGIFRVVVHCLRETTKSAAGK